MKPILFEIGEFVLPAYSFLIMLAVLAGTWIGIRFCRRHGLPVIYGIDMVIIAIVAGFLGGRIAHVLVEAPAYYWEDPLRFFYFWQGGFVSWGAHLAIFLAWVFYLRWRHQPAAAYFDLAALVLPWAEFIGRGGCLLTGCCFGKPTDFFLHLTFNNPASTAYHFYPGIPLHATQIYLMLNGLILALVLWRFSVKRWRFQGQLFSFGLGLYAVGRFLIEWLRGDVDRGVYFDGVISSGQIAVGFYLLISIPLYFYFKKRALPPPHAH